MRICECAPQHKIADARQVATMHILQPSIIENLTKNLIKHSLTKLFIAICFTTLSVGARALLGLIVEWVGMQMRFGVLLARFSIRNCISHPHALLQLLCTSCGCGMRPHPAFQLILQEGPVVESSRRKVCVFAARRASTTLWSDAHSKILNFLKHRVVLVT